MNNVNEPEEEDLDTQPPPLRVKCTDSDCAANLHCFLQKRGMKTDPGTCRACGANLVDWEKVHERNPSEVRDTVKVMQFEKIRHHMWHVQFDPKALAHARRLGLSGLKAKVSSRLASSIGKPRGAWDGRQTPFEGNAIFYAQHATATCCRKCLDYWHGIPPNSALTQRQMDYCELLVKEYLDQRLHRVVPDDPDPNAAAPRRTARAARR
jgi:hypothetical protein